MDASEDSQLQAAIKASLCKSTSHNPVVIDSDSDMDSNDLETFTDSEDGETSSTHSPVKYDSRERKKDSSVQVSQNSSGTSGEHTCASKEKPIDLSNDSSHGSNSSETPGPCAVEDTSSEAYKSYLGKDDGRDEFLLCM